MESLLQWQKDLMLVLIGICGAMILFIFLTEALSAKRKQILVSLGLSAMFLLIADRRAYIYRGDVSELGWWMVRISNFLVFFLVLVIIYFFNEYLIDLYTNEGKLKQVPKRLQITRYLLLAGIVLVVLSQFTGFYYTFDEMNRYQRGPGFLICYTVPLAVLLLQLSVILKYFKNLRRGMRVSLLLFILVSIGASILQVFVYGFSLNNIAIVAMTSLLYVFAIQDLSQEVKHSRVMEIEHYKEAKRREHVLFEQTAEALASAIDAKDPYTNGHSRRVAEYSLKIARAMGKTEEECEKVFFAGLLHDVGKIGVPSSIINKKGRLTDEEFEQIKQHPVKGGQILSSIKQSPWLSIGARYHHERYGGNGYPEGLKGEQIPEVARIIAVADAYDAMTSNRSYRNAIPQHVVREEIVKGMGTQFDPEAAKAMVHMIDVDSEYKMQERIAGDTLTPHTCIRCDSIYHDCSESVAITKAVATINFCCLPDDDLAPEECMPSLIIFDSLDGQVHPSEENNKNLLYFEYAQIRPDGTVIEQNIRKSEVRFPKDRPNLDSSDTGKPVYGEQYRIEAVRNQDHVLITLTSQKRVMQVILALPDASRFAYIALSGDHCIIHKIQTNISTAEAASDYIPRIAEEINFIRGCPVGDIPNIEVDGWRTKASEGIPITDNLTLSFHTMSLPTARMVWHCPFLSVFSSDDGQVNGSNFREYILLRLDGENWESDGHVENKVDIKHEPDFVGWDVWKEENKKGLDCVVTIRRDQNVITMETENLGVAVKSVTTIFDEVKDVSVALTGDQCAITNIRILHGA